MHPSTHCPAGDPRAPTPVHANASKHRPTAAPPVRATHTGRPTTAASSCYCCCCRCEKSVDLARWKEEEGRATHAASSFPWARHPIQQTVSVCPPNRPRRAGLVAEGEQAKPSTAGARREERRQHFEGWKHKWSAPQWAHQLKCAPLPPRALPPLLYDYYQRCWSP